MAQPQSIPIFRGVVDVHGKLHLDARSVLTGYLRRLANKPVEVIIRVQRKTRSHQANRYWWGVCIPLIAEACGYQPHEHEAVHDAVVRQIAGLRQGSDPKLQIRASTHDMSTAEFAELIEQTRIWAATELGCVIPDPDSVESPAQRVAA